MRGAGLVQIRFLACQSSMGGQVPWAHPTLDPILFSKLLGWQEEVQRVSPSFQNRFQHTNEVTSYLIENSLKDRTHDFVPLWETWHITLWTPKRFYNPMSVSHTCSILKVNKVKLKQMWCDPLLGRTLACCLAWLILLDTHTKWLGKSLIKVSYRPI